MKRIKNNLIPFLIIVIITACGGGGDDGPVTPIGGEDDDPVIPAPGAASLVFPTNNSECNTGVVNQNDTSLSTVTFEWNSSTNTDSYTVRITNLNTNTTQSQNSTTNSADVTILRGTPYSWIVISRATGTAETATSSTFRFYNEGPGIENYTPFPAEAISPKRGENLSGVSSVNLSWSASDLDDDINEFEVYFGIDETNLTSIGTTDENSIEGVSVNGNTTYFWYVVTTDSFGNSSTSEVFNFRIN